MNKILLSALILLPLMGSAQKVWDYADYTVTKVSNPERGEREADGLIAGGDRENSYAWRLAERGDEIYIATARNLASFLINTYGAQITAASGMSMDTFWGIIDAVANGDIVRNDANEGANIIAYNRKTGEFRVAYTAEPGVYQRMAVTFGEDVYFGSYSADQSVKQYILKLDKDGNFTKVFETTGTTAMRANCEYDGHLFFASVDSRTEIAEGEAAPLVKMAVLRKSNDDDTLWERVADYKDFGKIPYDPIHASWAGAPFWELASHAGYIYATAPSMAGFVIYKGRPAEGGESANEYGWHWEEVAGPNNGLNNPGLSDVEGGEPGTMRSLIGSVYEFNGELYAYNFDHAFGGEAQAFVGMLQQLMGTGTKASDYLNYMYNSLHNPQKVWKLNDATGKFEELTAFTELMEGTTNEYVWRMGEHNGKLYVATMDAGIFYNYLTQLTNGSFFNMSTAERLSKIGYIANVIKLLAMAKGDEKADELRAKLEQLQALLAKYTETTETDESVETVIDIKGLTEEINTLVAAYLQQAGQQASQQAAAQVAALTAVLVDLLEKAHTVGEAQYEGLIGLLGMIGDGSLKEQISAMMDSFNQMTDEQKRTLLTSVAQQIVMTVSGKLQETVADIYNRIDGKGIEMYAYINKAVRNNEWGFDLLRTADGGQTFEVITRNGFDDKYNYGCPSFLSTAEGLYFGTCNPFYGGQLFLLSDKGDDVVGISEAVATTDSNSATGYYTLSGQAVIGKPAHKGLYIKDGRKVLGGF